VGQTQEQRATVRLRAMAPTRAIPEARDGDTGESGNSGGEDGAGPGLGVGAALGGLAGYLLGRRAGGLTDSRRE
jgi:hypothetical protein